MEQLWLIYGGIFMAYQMTVTLTDQEYAALTEEANKRGTQPEEVLHEIMVQHLSSATPAKRPLTDQEFMEKLYREGKILNLPEPRPLTPEEQAERERIAQIFAGGKPMSEMIIEDRDTFISTFRQDSQRAYGVRPVTTATYTSAGDLCLSYRLRAYDAVQFACVLNLRDEALVDQGPVPIFVCADNNLIEMA